MSLLRGPKQKPEYKKFDVQGLSDVLEKQYVAQRRPAGKKTKKSFAPSGLGYGSGTCPRYWYYAFKGDVFFDDDTEPLAVASMAYGTEAHTRIQKLFNDAGLLVEEEKKIIHSDPPVFGFLDALIEWQGEQVPVEIKTTREQMFVHRQTTGEAPFYNLLQILIYMKVLGKKNGMLLYENKNTQELFVIPVEMDEVNTKIVEDAFQWMRDTYQAVKTDNQLPIRPFTQKSKVCKSCPVSATCWTDEEGVLTLSVLGVT